LYSPSPGRLLSYSSLLHSSIFRTRTTVYITLALFSLFFGLSSASAQTRARRARAEQEKSSKRVNDKKKVDDKNRLTLATREKKRVEDKQRTTVASNRRPITTEKKRPTVVETPARVSDNQVTQNPLVRKTALTYAPKAPDQTVKRPVLVNDITVVSRVSDKPTDPIILSTASKSSLASATIPSIWPVMGSLRSGVGVRSNPFGGSSTEFHKGQDIAAPMGTPVIATADGNITIAGWQRGYGWVVYIDHGNGITTRYGHLSRIDVAVGQPIRRGEQLGLVGSTGRSTGPHLHYEVRINGQPVSPLLYLPATNALSSARPQSDAISAGQR
jgi:murein DD-endopeptidase MepM/ murein hydrolase activator NlpD